MRLPDFLVIGVQRAGSTWLYNQLRKHPEICMGKYRKEISYFDKYYDRGDKWYESFFKHCKEGKIVGEVSPGYIHRESSAEKIYNLIPAVKLILILRNPIERAYSQYKKTVTDHGYTKSFTEYLQRYKGPAEKGLYYKQISNFLNFFPKNQINILIFEEMVKEPEDALKNVFGFLGVGSSFLPVDYKKNVNPSHKPIAPKLYAFCKSIADKLYYFDLSWLVEFTKRIGLNKLFFLGISHQKDFDSISAEAYNYLKDYFQEDLKKLSELLGRDMNKLWGI
jgi:hypothetical protein